jgi:hypothetical protein
MARGRDAFGPAADGLVAFRLCVILSFEARDTAAVRVSAAVSSNEPKAGADRLDFAGIVLKDFAQLRRSLECFIGADSF